MPALAMKELEGLVALGLRRAGASEAMAGATARALVAAEAEGMASHGLFRAGQYAGHLRSGRVDGSAEPRVVAQKPAACLVDAADGLAFPACALAVQEAISRARTCGAAFAGVTRSHHFGVAAWHLEPVALAGMVGLAFGNSPAAMPAWGGRRPVFGTNPIAAMFPRRDAPPLIIDLSLSEVARGKLMVAAREGKPIPLGWAVDREGKPTTDAKAALDGMMLPAGGVKGAMLALVVELLCCALTGASFGFEADSFLSETGNRPRVGQAFVVIDPGALAGDETFHQRIELLVQTMLLDDTVRLPGERRVQARSKALGQGIEVSPELLGQLQALAAA
ncbi:MAG: Ldh family oxidoreductase [Lautropia sp.]|nr:Ldh family oxidoreductase [Lautropia sp.]